MIERFRILWKEEGRTGTINKNAIESLVLKGISVIVSFALVPLTIDYVSTELYGIWLTLSSILTWVCFMDLGFTQGLKNKLIESIASGDYSKGKYLVSTTYFMMVVIFVPLCIVLECVVPHVNWTSLLNVDSIFQQDIVLSMRALVALSCLQFIVNVVISVIAAFQRVALSNSFAVIGNILSLVIICIAIHTIPPSLFFLSTSMILAPIIVTVVASIILFNREYKQLAPSIGYIRKEYISDLFSLGYKFFIINIQVVVVYQATNFLISFVTSPIEVTNYNIAYRYLNIAMMLFTTVVGPLWPAYSDAYARDDFKWMREMHKKLIRLLLFVVCICIFLVIFSKPFYLFWIGTSVQIPFLMTVSVSIYVIAYCWCQLNCSLLAGMGKITLETIIVVVGMLAHVPLSLFLNEFFGVYGILLSMILINLVYAIVFEIQVRRILNQTAVGLWIK